MHPNLNRITSSSASTAGTNPAEASSQGTSDAAETRSSPAPTRKKRSLWSRLTKKKGRSKSTGGVNYFDWLPDELVQNILAQALPHMAPVATCQRFRNIIRDPSTWRAAGQPYLNTRALAAMSEGNIVPTLEALSTLAPSSSQATSQRIDAPLAPSIPPTAQTAALTSETHLVAEFRLPANALIPNPRHCHFGMPGEFAHGGTHLALQAVKAKTDALQKLHQTLQLESLAGGERNHLTAGIEIDLDQVEEALKKGKVRDRETRELGYKLLEGRDGAAFNPGRGSDVRTPELAYLHVMAAANQTVRVRFRLCAGDSATIRANAAQSLQRAPSTQDAPQAKK